MDREKEGQAGAVSVKMVKSPWPVDIPNGTEGEAFCVHSRTGMIDVAWATGHVIRMKPEEIEGGMR